MFYCFKRFNERSGLTRGVNINRQYRALGCILVLGSILYFIIDLIPRINEQIY